MTLAFYAPLKPPDHPVPSGDRAMARAVIAALEFAGFEVAQTSTLRSRDGEGNTETQRALFQQAETEIPTLVAKGQDAGWRAWITYHNYYKAPDLLGPQVAEALNIPYLQIEATRAKKRLKGPWADFAKAAEAACDAATMIFYLTERDGEALLRDAPKGQSFIHLRPFLAREDLPAATAGNGPLLSVGMMRTGDKLASYQIIAETLALLPTGKWHLNIAGDGPARADVERVMAPFEDAVTFLGELDQTALSHAYEHSALLFWPGVNEAFGLAYLEAQARGVPVLAQDRPGVRDVLAPGAYPAVTDGAAGLAKRLTELLSDPDMRHATGKTARHHIGAHHLLPAAAETLRAGLASVGVSP